MKKTRKRGADGYGRWDKYDDFEVDLSFSWLVICLVILAIGVFIMLPRVPVIGVIWVVAVCVYLFRKIREVFKQRALDRMEPEQEEKIPYHIRVAMEQEQKEVRESNQGQGAQGKKQAEQLDTLKRAGLIEEEEYQRRRGESSSADR